MIFFLPTWWAVKQLPGEPFLPGIIKDAAL
jgi:hypothetical protein